MIALDIHFSRPLPGSRRRSAVKGWFDMDYRLGLYEKSMPAGLTWREMLTAGRAAGFDQLEISIDESDARLARLEWTDQQKLELLAAQVETEMPVRTMCLSGHRKYPLGSRDPQVRARGMEIMRKAVDFAGDMGIRIIQLAGYDVYYENGGADTRSFFAENLALSVQYAAAHGVALGFETMETPFMDTISKSMNYVREIDSPYLGVYPDLGNLTNACELYDLHVSDEIRAGRGHLMAMHLKETVPGKYRDMDFGTGRVDFISGIRDAYACGVRLFTAEFWHDGCVNWQERLKNTHRFLREKFDCALGSADK